MSKVIFLVDMNAFFIGCEMAREPSLKGKPAAVAGDPKTRSGIILAANYDARKYGVKTTMVIHEAKKLCPGLVLVPPDHGLYEYKSGEVMKILSRYSPLIQQNSIDEAWIDLTGCETLFGSPLNIAQQIMEEIKRELDLWCSIGISENKFLAKMASELKKPLGITEVWEKDVNQKIWPLPVRAMYGVGNKTEQKLCKLAIFTIGDLACSDRKVLVRYFGKYGEDLHSLANGHDPSPVIENLRYDSKSISRSTTLSSDTLDLEYAKTVLLRLSEEIGEEARQYENKGKTISIVIKYGDFESITRQKTVSPTYLTKEIYHIGAELLSENWNAHRPVRLLGVGLSNFEESSVQQLSIFDKIEDNDSTQREEKLERTMDIIKSRFGTDKIKRARTLQISDTNQ